MVAPHHRVWLKHTSSHMCVVNSLVLDDLGIGETAPDVDGGRVTIDADGRPTGLLASRGNAPIRPQSVPAYRSPAPLRATLPPPFEFPIAATVRETRRGAGSVGAPEWVLRSWQGEANKRVRGVGHERFLCSALGVLWHGRLVEPSATPSAPGSRIV